jgi:beta-lactamase regulating signal transducer with metallopeptidase domain
MIDWIEALPLSVPAGWLMAFVLHATVLLTVVWIIERCGGLKHPGWAEWAWRVALFGAFVSVAVEQLPWDAMRASSGGAVSMTAADPSPQSLRVADPGEMPMPMPPPTPRAAAATATGAADAIAVARTAGIAPVALPLASDAMLILIALWLSGTAVLFVRLLVQARGLLRLRRRLLHEGAPAGEELQRRLQALAQEMRVRVPTLRILSGLASPLVLPGAVLLPRWAEGLDVPQQRAMLAHELAHLRRRDPLWRPLQRLALVPLFFHPLAWHALRRLETLAETLCDAAAVERSGSGRPLAECLAECLARSADVHNTEQRGAGWALAMAERSGGIVDRVRTLLENSQMKISTIPTRWRWTAAVLVLIALIALPGVMVISRPGMIANAFEDHSLSVTVRNGLSTYAMRSHMPTPGERLRVVLHNDVEFNAQESDVVRMGGGAKLEIEQVRAGVKRKITIAPVAGRIQRTYLVDGVARPFDADGKAWLAGAIPDIFRMTGMQAEARSKRLLGEGGVPRLLAEIALLNNDHARAEYLGQLFAQATPDTAQTAQALTLMKAMDSDFEKRRALDIALKQPQLEATNQATMLALARGIDSDFERAEWLIDAAAKLPLQGENAPAWSQALLAFDSDFERKRSLQALIESGQPREEAVTTSLRAIRGMDSDFEQRSVLETAAKAGVAVPDADYLVIVDALDSDFEKREALLALIRGAAPDAVRSQNILRSVRGMSSDFERSEVLKALAAAMPNDVALIENYRAVTRGMSDFERAQAEKALDRFYRS